MDIDNLLRVLQFAFTVLVGLYSVTSARKASSKLEAQQLADRLTSQDNRILIVEQQMLHIPDSGQMTELVADMRAIKAELAGVAKELAPLSRSLDRINDYLLNGRPV